MTGIEQFTRLVAVPDAEIDLGRAALQIAATRYPALDVDSCLRRLDGLASGARELIGDAQDPLHCSNALSQFLFDEAGFRGNTDDYYDPRNSYLSDVLDRRPGIPITLSLLYIEVGRRLEIPLVGIGMPGHFLVRHRDVADLFVDPFHSGMLLSEAECAQRVEDVTGGRLQWHPAHLAPVDNRSFLARMLRNLKVIYLQRLEHQEALSVLDLLVALLPDDADEQRDRLAISNRLSGRSE